MLNYEPILFQGREQLTGELVEWGTRAGESTIQQIVGSPGVGKSWFLAHLRIKFEEVNPLTFWLDLKDHISKSPTEFIGWLTRQWLPQITNDISNTAFANNLSGFTITGTLSNDIQALVKLLCARDQTVATPILLIDSLDEIDQDLQKLLEKYVFIPFLSGYCARIIVATRDNYRINTPELRWASSERVLLGLPLEATYEQLRARHEKLIALLQKLDDSSTRDWEEREQLETDLFTLFLIENDRRQETLSHLKQLNETVIQARSKSISDILQQLFKVGALPPYLTSWLWGRLMLSSRGELNEQDVEDCIKDYLIRATIPQDKQDMLINIAKQGSQPFIPEYVKGTLGVDIFSDEYRVFFEEGMIMHAEGTQRFRVDAGLVSLVQILESLDGQEGRRS